MAHIFGETQLRVEYSEVTESAGKMLSKLKGLVVTTNVNINITVTVLLVVVCKILALFSAWSNKNLGDKIKHLVNLVGDMNMKEYCIDRLTLIWQAELSSKKLLIEHAVDSGGVVTFQPLEVFRMT